MSTNDGDIPSLTLRVLQNIQGELVGLRGDVQELRGDVHEVRGEVKELRGDVQELRGDVHEVRGEVKELRGEVHTLGDRFENFLTFVGRDVQDLKTRVTALEARRGS